MGDPQGCRLEKTMGIYKMDMITAFLKYKWEQFVSYWEHFVSYVALYRPDFFILFKFFANL